MQGENLKLNEDL